jgi:hypothetical protein
MQHSWNDLKLCSNLEVGDPGVNNPNVDGRIILK